jgi:hypothetical protein
MAYLLLLPLVPPVVSAPLALVGYVPPAGEPIVDEGEVVVKHELFGYMPCETVYSPLPPVPSPRSSPATTMSVEPSRTEGVQLNPVPWPDNCVIWPSGIEKDCPPGMTPWKDGLLLVYVV